VIHIILQSIGVDCHILPEIPDKRDCRIVRHSGIRGIPWEDVPVDVKPYRMVLYGIGDDGVPDNLTWHFFLNTGSGEQEDQE
jgi:hypothetical protein